MAFSTQHFRNNLTRFDIRGSYTPLAYVRSWDSGLVI